VPSYRVKLSKEEEPFNMVPIVCPETSVSNTLPPRNNPEDGIRENNIKRELQRSFPEIIFVCFIKQVIEEEAM
jgi:hypothetical protein